MDIFITTSLRPICSRRSTRRRKRHSAQAADLMPQNVQVIGRMGFVYEKQKKWPQALNAYKKAEEIKSSKEIKDAIARVNENMKK